MSDNTNVIVAEKHGVPPVIPEGVFNIHIFRACERIAQVMAASKLVPTHLQGKFEDCFIITQQCYRWGDVDPFAAAQCTAVVHGKLCYEGKLVAAIVEKLAGVTLNYEYTGSGENRSVKVFGKRKKDEKPVDILIVVKNVKTTNDKWNNMPDQMLAYRGAREWARRYTPGVLLGIYTDDEMPNDPSTPIDVTPSKATALDNFEERFSAKADAQDVTPSEKPIEKADTTKNTPPAEKQATPPAQPAATPAQTITVDLNGTTKQVASYAEAATTLIDSLTRYGGADHRRAVIEKNNTLISEIHRAGLKEETRKISEFYPDDGGQ